MTAIDDLVRDRLYGIAKRLLAKMNMESINVQKHPTINAWVFDCRWSEYRSQMAVLSMISLKELGDDELVERLQSQLVVRGRRR